jgi:hypothetical protein
VPILMIRYEVGEHCVAEVSDLVEQAFAGLAEHQPPGVRYTYLRRHGGTEFVALLELDEGVANPLPGIEAARHLQATVAACASGPAPTPQAYDVLGTWRLLG